jgi:hypothetical protein
MFLLGFDFGISSYNISKIDFSYKGSVFSTKPTANGTPISFGFFGTYGFKESPLLLGFGVKLHSGSLNTKWDYYGFTYGSSNGSNLNMLFPVSKQFYIRFGMDFDYITSITTTYSENTNLNVIPKENKIVSLSLKFLGRII